MAENKMQISQWTSHCQSYILWEKIMAENKMQISQRLCLCQSSLVEDKLQISLSRAQSIMHFAKE